jgi:(2Fe-2S) ferredoxin
MVTPSHDPNLNNDLASSPDSSTDRVDELSSMSIAVKALGIDCITRHIFICADASKPKCVDREASLESWDYLKRRLQELQLDRPQSERPNCIFRTKANCLRLCQKGPIMVIYPDGVWYHSVSPIVVEEIIQQHLLCNKIVGQYVLQAPTTVWQNKFNDLESSNGIEVI